MNKLINHLQLMIMQNEDVIYDLGLDGVEIEKEHQKHLKEENKYYERVITELQGLEKLKKELGIDLLFLFNKVLKEGIVDDIGNVYYAREISLGIQLYHGKPTILLKYFNQRAAYHAQSCGLNYFPQVWDLRDYKKTWWLKEDYEVMEDEK